MSELNLQNVLDAFTENAAIVDEVGQIHYVNKAWLEFGQNNSGRSSRYSVGANYFDVIRKAADKDDEYAIQIMQGIEHVLSKKIDQFELEYPCNSATEERWFIANVKEIDVTERRYFLFTHKNVTNLVMRERRIQQIHRIDSLGQLTSGIAHDFNNLLGIMLGYMELIRERIDLDDTTRRYFEEAITASRRGADLVTNLLSFARSKPLEIKYIDLNNFIEDVYRLLERVIGEDVDFTHDLPDDVLVVHVDPAMLSSAIMNLSINARHAMPNGGHLVIRARAAKLEGETLLSSTDKVYGDFVKIDVSDSGSGIESENLTRVLEPYFTTKEEFAGTGLGLAMVKGFAEQANGFIDIKSKTGEGTTVTLLLPRYDDHNLSQKSYQVDVFNRNLQKCILLVEDDPEVRHVVAEMLLSLKHQVIQVENVVEALRLLKDDNRQIDVLLCDLVLDEDMSGQTLCKRVSEDYPHIKTLLMSGYGQEYTDDDPEQVEIVLNKPFSLTRLSHVLEGAFQQ